MSLEIDDPEIIYLITNLLCSNLFRQERADGSIFNVGLGLHRKCEAMRLVMLKTTALSERLILMIPVMV